MNLVIVLGNQLFNPSIYTKKNIDSTKTIFFLREDRELCTYYKFHKQKIIFFLAAMRTYAKELITHKHQVHYEDMSVHKDWSYEDSLENFIKEKKIKKVSFFEIEDKFFEKRILKICASLGLEVEVWQSPMFLTSREQFETYLAGYKKPFMKTFYEGQRRRLNVLMMDDKPVGGKWSYDEENRSPLPKKMTTPDLPTVSSSKIISDVSALCEKLFPNHPGDAHNFWLPVDRAGAQDWFRVFLRERLEKFGPYEDAISPHSDFLFHSVLTPFLNVGLLTPGEVIKTTLNYGAKNKIPLASLEGFIRQIIGWREFIRGIYQNYSEKQDEANFWNHKKKLSTKWYKGETGVPPLDQALTRVWKRGYLHHIERLMVVGSLMLLLEVDPKEAHRWFMEMFIDSSDWVMGPNVYGMALFSDGGIFATKPYFCGSNYYRKMGGFPEGEWCDGVDGLYWGFIKKHPEFFQKNPRLSMMARSADKIPKQRWQRIQKAAGALSKQLVVS